MNDKIKIGLLTIGTISFIAPSLTELAIELFTSHMISTTIALLLMPLGGKLLTNIKLISGLGISITGFHVAVFLFKHLAIA